MFEVTASVRLGQGEDRRLRDGHLWIYSSEIDSVEGHFEDGDVVVVKDFAGRKIGAGFANRGSKIAVRLLTRGSKLGFTEEIFLERLDAAVARRRHLKTDALRLVNAEADLLPGLVVDKYNDVVVLQTHIAGWERRRSHVVAAVDARLNPRVVVLKNDALAREAEGLERYSLLAKGRLDGNPVILENGCEIEVDVLGGQKTGFYLDLREIRKLALPHVEGKRVLDAFCYTGAWSLMCAGAGAREVLGLDSSDEALALARRNAERNRASQVTGFVKADIFDELPRLAADKSKFDVVILDPPSLAKTKRALSGAERGYVHLNRLALGLLAPGGLLLTCSCSHHVTRDRFRAMLQTAAALARKQVAVLASGGQPEDHPSLLGLPETDYLKCLLLAVH